jgi:hypothetical protein
VAYILSPYLQDAKHEVAEKPVVEAAEPVDAKQADDANGELSQPEDSDASSQFATPFESEEFERPLPDDGRKRYNSTFLLSIAPLCKDLPPQIEVATLSALQWVEGMGEKPLAPPRKFIIMQVHFFLSFIIAAAVKHYPYLFVLLSLQALRSVIGSLALVDPLAECLVALLACVVVAAVVAEIRLASKAIPGSAAKLSLLCLETSMAAVALLLVCACHPVLCPRCIKLVVLTRLAMLSRTIPRRRKLKRL